MKNTTAILLSGLFILTACASANQTSTTDFPATPSSLPTATEIMPLPTPASPGVSITWDQLQVTMDRLEVTQDYMTDYGSTRIPPAGQKFLWIQVRLKNTGQVEMDVP